jgi:DNA-binding GntR family transcriptional regulator
MMQSRLQRQQPLSHSAVDLLREWIISGELKPGEPLVQAQLAERLGVSRAPVREALQKLEEEGFVQNPPYRGAIVAPLTQDDVAELRQFRSFIEERAAQLIIERLTDDELTELEEIYARMSEAADRNDPDAVDHEDLALHTRICELSGNGPLREVWSVYSNRFRRVLTFCNRVNNDLRMVVDEHLPLLEALRKRDLDGVTDFYRNRGTDLSHVLPVNLPEEFERATGRATPDSGAVADEGS